MAVQIHTCVTICCDGCGAASSPEGEGPLHYPTVEAAVVDLVDDRDPERSWSIDGDRHLCPDCICVRDGHRWEPPRRCGCGGRILLPGHSEDCSVRYRACSRCLHVEDLDPALLAP